jgi:hypothetical protein
MAPRPGISRTPADALSVTRFAVAHSSSQRAAIDWQHSSSQLSVTITRPPDPPPAGAFVQPELIKALAARGFSSHEAVTPHCSHAVPPPPRRYGDVRSEAGRLFAADGRAESLKTQRFLLWHPIRPLQIELLTQKSFCLFVDQKMVSLGQIPFEHCMYRICDLKTCLF